MRGFRPQGRTGKLFPFNLTSFIKAYEWISTVSTSHSRSINWLIWMLKNRLFDAFSMVTLNWSVQKTNNWSSQTIVDLSFRVSPSYSLSSLSLPRSLWQAFHLNTRKILSAFTLNECSNGWFPKRFYFWTSSYEWNQSFGQKYGFSKLRSFWSPSYERKIHLRENTGFLPCL